MQIEYERFKDPVFRIFHTELETVYEEKNMSLDSDDDKVFEALFGGLFRKHTYGTQTTIGKVEHLKNPSIKSLREYYQSRYVPNNMAILLSGDFNPDEMIKEIDATFGLMPSKPLKPFVPAVEDPITSPIVKEVVGPDAESVTIGYRMGGASTKDADLVRLCDMILTNSTAGLIDLTLNQGQKVLEAGSFSYVLKDYSVNVFFGKAKEGQSLEEVRDLILGQIDRMKKGDFPNWLLPAIVNDIKLSEIKSSETNRGRVFSMLNGFSKEIPRNQEVHNIEILSKITKKDIMDFAQANYGNNYVIVYKRTGTDKDVQKVAKPPITPVTMNRNDESEFLKKIVSMSTDPVQPVFLDYEKDVKKLNLDGGIQVLYNENTENNTFSLYYYFEFGTNQNKAIGVALDYLKYLGTSKYTPNQIQEEFYKIGCTFNVSASEDELWVSLSGLSENMVKGIVLFEHLLSDAKAETEPYNSLVSDIRKRRADDKLSKSTILWSAMYNFGIYGKKSPFTNICSDAELTGMKPEDLVTMVSNLNSYQHKILYYGPENPDNLRTILNKEHKVPGTLKPVPTIGVFEQLPNEGSQVYTIDYDMKQAEILMMSRSKIFDKNLIPVIRLFNEYYGGSMNSIVFQEIRESKGLAYSAYAGYRTPVNADEHFYLMSFIGTQSDKLPEAMKGMMGLFDVIPESEKAMNNSKDAIINKIRTERITKSAILFSYLNAGKLGLNYDIRKDVYDKIPSMTFKDLKNFHNDFIRNKNFNILVLGNKSNLDMNVLQKYGDVQTLTLEEIFGY